MNVDFILASAAEVEWLWSIATDIMQANRRGMNPILLEALLFLKTNRRFWDQETVRAAMTEVKLDGITERLQNDIDHGEIHHHDEEA
jgi:predicted HAD superfamily phosphohydrolase YqeG